MMYKNYQNTNGNPDADKAASVSLPHHSQGHFHLQVVLHLSLYKYQSLQYNRQNYQQVPTPFIPHLVGLSFINWRIPDLCLDFTMRSSTAIYCLGWYNILQRSLKWFTKASTLRSLFPGVSVVGSTTCSKAIRDLYRSLERIARAQSPW